MSQSENPSGGNGAEAHDEIARETMEVDVLFVGAGVSCLAGAIKLMQVAKTYRESGAKPGLPELTVAVVEKGAEVGAHILSGAVMKPVALDELLPGWRDEAPIASPVTREVVSFFTETMGFDLPLVPLSLDNHGNYVVSASRLTRWLAKKAEELGINIFPGFPAVDVLWDGDRVVGVRTGDKGIDAHGNRKANFEPGVLLKAKVTVFGEGVLGHCTRLVTKKLGLDAGRNPWQFETGVKELIRLPKGKGCPGFVLHTLGWPLDKDTMGGTFLYGFDDDCIAVGLVVSLDYRDPGMDPQYMLQKFKSHPRVAEIIEGGTVEEYGGKALTAGGWYSMQQPYCDGAMFVGESAQIIDVSSFKGLHLGMKSGMLAAETALEALLAGDVSANVLRKYSDRIENSYIKKEMWKSRNFHQAFDKGLYLGMIRSGIGMYLGTVGRRDGHKDWAALQPLAVATDGGTELSARPKVEIPTFKMKLDDLFLSGTGHDEHQPSHLKVLDTNICSTRCAEEFGNPCTRFCPAQVYEMVAGGEHGTKKLQVNFSNCVHCKTCDIKDPYQVITWVPPEGGGGPKYTRL
jgi:electron-transferring-flavoprotein dehydrogenase